MARLERFLCFALFYSVTSQGLASSLPPPVNGRPRGVSRSKKTFYDPSKPFTCLDGSNVIPFENVNDDFCDCRDGTDEPGTPACSMVGGKFHCANKGHKPLNIPSSRVNDGICDCCDGTDEYSGMECPNQCKELGAKAREEARRLREVQQQGFQMRQEYSQQGHEKRTDRQRQVEELKQKLAEAQAEADRLKAIKEEAEKPETEAKDAHREKWEAEKAAKERGLAEEAFRNLDTDADGILSLDEVKAHSEFDKDSNGEVSDEEATGWLNGTTESDVLKFATVLWADIKSVYVAPTDAPPAVETPPGESTEPAPAESNQPPSESTAEEGAVPPTPPAPAADSNEAKQEGGEPVWKDEATDSDDEPLDDYDDDDDEDDDVQDDGDERVGEAVSQPADPEMPEYDDATKELIAVADKARDEFKSADKIREDKQRELEEVEKLLNTDLGEEQEFYPLQGHCYEYTDREYTYKMCAFDRVSQQPKSGGSETSLGRWGQWVGSPNKYSTMKYENGESCWNGPSRSATVKLVCGTTNELRSAAEPNRCEYEFEFVTPSVCTKPQEKPVPVDPDVHEEL